mgnify:CR=1 FL=1
MKIAVMGAGALGCYFGGRLAHSGIEVSFVGRGAHLEALKRNGLRIESPLGDVHLPDIMATDNPAEIGPVDLVIFVVKLYDTEEAARAMAPLLGPDTAVVSFQNGIDGWQRIGEIVGGQRVVGGLAVIPADIRAPGIVRHNSSFARLVFGEFDGSSSERCAALERMLKTAGVDAELVGDIDARIWDKFIVLSALSAATAVTRLPLGPILDDPRARPLFEQAIEETAAVGERLCPSLSEGAAERARALAATFPPTMRASMLDDLERGKRLELDHLSGAVVRLGAQAGIATPTHAFVLSALSPYAAGKPDLR